MTVRLDIQVVTYAASPDRPEVRFLIDGAPMLAGTSLSNWTGFDPEVMLDEGAPLLPDAPFERVAVWMCHCREAGCGVVAPLIVRQADRVLWADFRDYVGVFIGPTVETDPDGGLEHPLADLTFDRAQYETEVRRVSRDRSWEPENRSATSPGGR